MDFYNIDWNAMWQEESQHSMWNSGISRKEEWNSRAESFNKGISRAVTDEAALDKEDYISKMLARIEVKPEWSVLDIGCGPGTLAIPLAKKARSVTALDLSSEMLKHLKVNAAKSGVDNIRYLNFSWQDAFGRKQVTGHDVVVASRSLMSGDMKEAIANIIAVTRQAAYLTFPVVHLSFDQEVYRAIGRERIKHPPYIYIYNLLFQMGIMANVEILNSKIESRYCSIDEAIESIQRRTDPFTPAEKAKLVEFLEQKFAGQKDSPFLTHQGHSKWALIWWRKEEQ